LWVVFVASGRKNLQERTVQAVDRGSAGEDFGIWISDNVDPFFPKKKRMPFIVP